MSLSNDKTFMKQLDNDIEQLSKSLYLDNPDLWLEFLSKSGDKNFDEMSLFFATKSDMLSILRYAVEENNFDLNLPSKNKDFLSIKENILDVALKYNARTILDYLSLSSIDIINRNASDLDVEYKCPNCKVNIFEYGYNVLIASTCTYSPISKKIIRSTPTELDIVVCSSCNFEIKGTTPSKLENITNIENCTDCGSNLTKSGIVKEVVVNYNETSKEFLDGDMSYCCKSCRNPISSNQLEYFNII
ncbi:MAG: hypothetical protein ACRDB0_05175 [Paraclostridium sp.]